MNKYHDKLIVVASLFGTVLALIILSSLVIMSIVGNILLLMGYIVPGWCFLSASFIGIMWLAWKFRFGPFK